MSYKLKSIVVFLKFITKDRIIDILKGRKSLVSSYIEAVLYRWIKGIIRVIYSIWRRNSIDGWQRGLF